VTLRLIALDCPSCGSAMRGDPSDVVFFCGHCGSAALLGSEGLEPVESTALLPSPGRHAQVWKPAWVLEAAVAVRGRQSRGGGGSDGWSGHRTFVIPAFALPLPDLILLIRGLSAAAATVGEVPREPIRGGTLQFEDALTLARHLVIGGEVSKPDMLASLDITISEKGHRLAATPFEDAGNGQLRCAITGVVVRPQVGLGSHGESSRMRARRPAAPNPPGAAGSRPRAPEIGSFPEIIGGLVVPVSVGNGNGNRDGNGEANGRGARQVSGDGWCRRDR
jgi:hypothetical protein